MPGPGPTTPLSNPDFGTVDPAGGFDAAADRTGDFAFAFIQQGTDGGAAWRSPATTGCRAVRDLTVVEAVAQRAQTPLAWGTALELWGPLTYTVLVDGKQVAQTQTTKRPLPVGALSGRACTPGASSRPTAAGSR